MPEATATPGILSLLPVTLALALAFRTRNAFLSLFAGCVVGVVIAGFDPATGMADLLKRALGTEDFIWVVLIAVAVGIMIAFYLRAGVVDAFTVWASGRVRTRRGAAGVGWGLGVFVFFSDYFSPLFAGPIARPLTDRHKVSREMLAYLLDSCCAPVATLLPLSAWAVYIAGLLQGYGPIDSVEAGMNVFIRAIPYNFYGWFAVLLAGALAFDLLPHYGPMRRAERRALDEGKVLGDGALPLAGEEMQEIESFGKRPNLLVYLVMPVVIVFSTAIGTFFWLGSTRILEAFLAAVFYQTAAMALGGYFRDVQDGVGVAVHGIKSVLPAILILALAYSINAVSKSLGAQEFIIASTQDWMTARWLPLVTFLTAAVISFVTGTSWGTYAILTPFVLPVAMNLTAGTVSEPVLLTVGALVGGALFGDHASPISDTTCLASFGAACDHMDHVTTQLPYALTAAGAAVLLLLVMGT